MANIKSAKKRVKIIKVRTLRNKSYMSALKTAIRRVEECSEEEKVEAVRKALSFLDRAVSKGILKRNTADRKKSSLVRKHMAVS